MSNTGKQSPLGINVSGALLQDTGLYINAVTEGYVGTSHTVTSYTPGTVVTDTCLNYLTLAIQEGYQIIGVSSNEITLSTYGNLISIGSTSIPALGNSKPPTYTWIGPANSGDTTSTAAQEKSWYPYTQTNTTNTYPSSNPTPRQWSALTSTDYTYDITQHGWIRLFALQAWNEFNYNNIPSNTTISYKDFLSSFATVAGFISYNNTSINSMSLGDSFLKNTYSNMNDLITADITGINLATNIFGQDLIATGKSIDLSTIATFGLPSNLLKTLKKYNAITASLSYAIISSGIEVNELDALMSGTIAPTETQEKQLYGAFLVITGIDLTNILIPLNCSTKGLETLADLLNPVKLFPNSYQSLTVPVYNANPGPTNSKTYYPIYSGTGINSSLLLPQVISTYGFEFGFYLQDIIPKDIATACGAFSCTVRQISKIETVPIELFAQIVANIETVSGLPLLGNTNVPTNTTLSTGGLDQVSYGSGPNGSYTVSDFFGCMSGLPYPWKDIQSNITSLQTANLISIYTQLYNTIIAGNPGMDTDVSLLISQANAEIETIRNNNPIQSNTLNTLWNITGTQLTIEQRARDMALSPVPSPRDNRLYPYPVATVSFVDSIPTYAVQTEPHMYSQTIEAISDLTSSGGQSLIAMMRQERNQIKLRKAGLELDNNVPAQLNPTTTKILMGNGTVSIAKSGQGVPAGDATFTNPSNAPVVLNNVLPKGHYETPLNNYCLTTIKESSVLGTIPNDTSPGNDGAGPNITQISDDDFVMPVAGGYALTSSCDMLNVGQPIVSGSLAGSPYSNIIEPQLSIPYISGILSSPTYSVADAIDEVVRCNCDCWLN